MIINIVEILIIIQKAIKLKLTYIMPFFTCIPPLWHEILQATQKQPKIRDSGLANIMTNSYLVYSTLINVVGQQLQDQSFETCQLPRILQTKDRYFHHTSDVIPVSE